MLTDREKALAINSLRSYMKAIGGCSPLICGDIDRKLAFAAEALEVPAELLEEMRVEQQRFLQQIAGAAGWEWEDGE